MSKNNDQTKNQTSKPISTNMAITFTTSERVRLLKQKQLSKTPTTLRTKQKRNYEKQPKYPPQLLKMVLENGCWMGLNPWILINCECTLCKRDYFWWSKYWKFN